MKLCEAYGCKGFVTLVDSSEFCRKCRSEYSVKALELMKSFQAPIGDILVGATKLFHTAQGISDYLGISLPTLYSWIARYHNLSFRQFKRKHICPGNTCIVVDHGVADYSWKYTMADRLHAQKACVCFVEGSESLMMTTLSVMNTEETLKSSLAYESESGIHHLRYPVKHLPIFKPHVVFLPDGRTLHPVYLEASEYIEPNFSVESK
jgi:hypothetical protein